MSSQLDKAALHSRLGDLAAHHVYIGTSSWKYPGWCGQVYTESRYHTRNRYSEKRFNEECLAEYAETFKSVCVDAGYYKFPDERYLEKLTAHVPGGFKFSFKVTDVITLKHFPKLPRFGKVAGKPNENFLNATIFKNSFLRPCATFRANIGVLIFEFSQFYPRDFERGRDFVEALDRFLDELLADWQYRVEIRNARFLRAEYFDALRKYDVAHVHNSWSRMPTVAEQMRLEGSQTTDFLQRVSCSRPVASMNRPSRHSVLTRKQRS